MVTDVGTLTQNAVDHFKGLIPATKPTYIRRTFLDPGRRLGLDAERYDTSHTDGGTSERWFLSTTRKGTGDSDDPKEGLSYLATGKSEELLLLDAINAAPELIFGVAYARAHPNINGMGWLFKVYDFATRIPNHFHQMQLHADQLGLTSKDECYHFPERVDMGKDPTTFVGFLEHMVKGGTHREVVADYIRRWEGGQINSVDDDYILRFGYEVELEDFVNGGLYVPSGVLHAPGTALTFELQENSDVFGMLQAFLSDGKPVDPELLYKDVHPDLRAAKREYAVIDQINWDLSANRNFAQDYRVTPVLRGTQQGSREDWIFYGQPNNKFSGTRVIVPSGKSYTSQDKGAYGLVIWEGDGVIEESGSNVRIKGTAARKREGNADEFLVTFDRARSGVNLINTGKSDLVAYKVSGPDINSDAPVVPIYTA